MAYNYPHHEHHQPARGAYSENPPQAHGAYSEPPPQARGPYSEPPPQGMPVKIICKVNKSYNLGIRNDNPVMVPADSEDVTQMWIKDGSCGERTKDNFGCPAFILINKASRKILKHSRQKGHQVTLVDHRPGLDEDILWTESEDFGEGFKAVRMASDTSLNMTLFQKGEKKSLLHLGGSAHEVKEGSTVVLDTWHQKDVQLWKVFPL